jgi:acyl-ACP thioesterase
MNEKNIKHPIHIDISMYNASGAFTPSAYQRMIMSMIEEHLDLLELGEKKLMDEHGISWVLLSTSIELKRRLVPTDKLVGTTWHAGGRIPSYRRDFIFANDCCEIVATGATISTLFENETRRICLNKDKLSVVDLEPNAPILETIERRLKLPSDAVLVEKRRVRPSMTDGVGHVNNTKYGDFVYDAMTDEERASLSEVKRIDVWFNYELREGDEFEIFKAVDENRTLYFTGKRVGEAKSSFDMKISLF